MQKILFLIIITAISICSCEQKLTAPEHLIFSGSIGNPGDGEIHISSQNGYSKKINVSNDGTFSDTLFLEEANKYDISFKNILFEQYLENGSHVNFTFNYKQPYTSAKSQGSYESFNNYLIHRNAVDSDFFKNRSNYFKLNEIDFEQKINTIQENLKTQFRQVKNVPENVKDKELRNISYGRISKKLDYIKNHRFYAANEISENFKKELDIAYNNNDDYVYSKDYQKMVYSYINKQVSQFAERDSIPVEEAQNKVFSELIKNEDIKNAFLFNKVSIMLLIGNTNQKDKEFKSFMNSSTNQKHKDSISKLYKSYQALASGKPSPKFYNYENYAGGTISLDDLKGKYVYIDIWATWCGPCIREIPYLQEIEKRYHHKNIHFVSISVDTQKDKNKWKKMIEEKRLTGIQLLAPSELKSPFIKAYKIYGIPRFILLDPHGNIVSSDCYNPSNKQLIDLLDSLI